MRQKSSVTLKQIAEKLGLSVTTVSRALNGEARRYRMSQETERKVLELARSLQFSPNHLARSLRLKKTATIGLVIPDVSNPFFADIARQITLGTRQHGYSVIVCDSQDNEETEIASLNLLTARGVEGIVLCPVGLSCDHLAAFEGGRAPIVLADRYFPGIQLPYVVSDNFAGAKEATNHLIENGHRRIVCLQGLRGTSPNQDRVLGYKQALRDRQLPVDEALIVGDSFSEENGYITTKLLLKAVPDFSAVLTLSNLISLGVLRALAEEGIRVPEDVSLISFDDQPYSPYLATPMTTVSQCAQEMGKIAVKLLFHRLHSPEDVVQGGMFLPTNLVIRKSVCNINDLKNEEETHRVCG